MDLSTSVNSASVKTAVCIAAHNRRAITLRCLRSLLISADERITVYLVDDGSTDGTAAAILEEFPMVRLIVGDGNLWWGGAMRLAMAQAMKDGAERIVWLNDDFILRAGALKALIGTSIEKEAITGGVLHGSGGTLSGVHKGTWGLTYLESPRELSSCAALPGNFVCFPRSAVKRLGEIDTNHFPHGVGDVDYTLRASGLGIPIIVVPDAAGDSDDFEQSHRDSWFHGSYPIWNAWKALFTYRSSLNPQFRWSLLTRHWGFRGVLAFFPPYGKLLLATVYRGVRPLLRVFSRSTSRRSA